MEKAMRRSDREIRDIHEIIRIMEQCDVCRLAFNDEEYPYILPVNFGMQMENGQIVLYFHGADQGRKYDLIRKDNRASFEMDRAHKLVLEGDTGNCTMEYESVMGRGKIEIVPEEEKYEALNLLMRHYHKEDFPFNQKVMPRTTVMKLVVEQITGKARKKR